MMGGDAVVDCTFWPERLSKASPNGFVLVVVLWVLAALTLVTVGVSQRAFLQRRAAAYSLDHARAMMLARGAAHRGMVELQNKWVKETLSRSSHVTHRGQAWAKAVNLLVDGDYFDLPQEDYARDVVQYRIEDAESRINLNLAPEEMLERIEAFGRRTARKIVQRRGEEVYEGDGPIPFQEIEEVRYLEDLDDEAWFGTEDQPALRDLLTTRGGGQINVNTASRDVLLCLPGMEREAVGQLLGFRAGEDGVLGTADDQFFEDYTAVVQLGGLRGNSAEAVYRYGKYTSDVFIIRGVATLRAGRVRASVTAVAIVNPENAIILSWREEPLGA